jgi:hypothetical protein
MADDQLNTVLASWSSDGDNNVKGLFTSPSSIQPVAGLPSTMLPHVAVPKNKCRISPWRQSIENTIFAAGSAPIAHVMHAQISAGVKAEGDVFLSRTARIAKEACAGTKLGGNLVVTRVVPVFTDPTPVISSVVATEDHEVTVDFATSASNIASAQIRLETRYLPGQAFRVTAQQGIDLTSPQSLQFVFQISQNISLDQRNIKVVITPTIQLSTHFESPEVLLEGAEFDNCQFRATLPPPTVNPLPLKKVEGFVGTTGVLRKQTKDFSG